MKHGLFRGAGIVHHDRHAGTSISAFRSSRLGQFCRAEMGKFSRAPKNLTSIVRVEPARAPSKKWETGSLSRVLCVTGFTGFLSRVFQLTNEASVSGGGGNAAGAEDLTVVTPSSAPAAAIPVRRR
jgi:hypothetical protein